MACDLRVLNFNAIDLRCRRSGGHQRAIEKSERSGVTFSMNPDTIAIVQNPSANAMRLRETKDKRTKPNTLHTPPDCIKSLDNCACRCISAA